jgi:hypothetical protein
MNYIFQTFDMVMLDQVEQLRRQDGAVGWRYRPDQRILELLFETDIQSEPERLEAIHNGMYIYTVIDGQRSIFHLPTHLSILEEIADAVECLLEDATGAQECFNPDEYIVGADEINRCRDLLRKLVEFDEGTP